MSRMATPIRAGQKLTIDISKVKGTIKTFHACRVELGVAKPEALMKKTMDGVSGAVGGLGVAVGGLVSGLIKNLPTKLTDKFDAWKFTKNADFVEACEILLQMMMQINEIFSPPVLSKPNLQYMLGQLQRQHISISFYGDSNVGKSTILNSIMGDRYLPVSRKSETAAAVHVVYKNPAVPPSPSADTISANKEDELIEFGTHHLVAEGVEKIRQALEWENKSLRSREDQRGSMKEFKLKLKHPPGGADSTSNFALIDNPGCDEFSSGAIFKRIKMAEDCSAAFVVVTSLDTYRNDDFSNFLMKIYSKNKGSIPYPKLSGPHLKIALNIPVQLSFFQKFLNKIWFFLFNKWSESMEESYIFQASVTPEQSTEEESLKNSNQDSNNHLSIQPDCMSTASEYSRGKVSCDASDDTAAAENVNASISSNVFVPKEDYFGTNETGEDTDGTSLEENNSISTTSSNPESKERSAYKKWSSDLEAVRDKIKTDVNKDIDDFFSDLDNNVVLKFCQLHYEVASTILKQFDCSLSSELKDCQDKLEENMKRLEGHRRTLEMLKNYKKKLDDRKKTFKEVCSKASHAYRRTSSFT